MRWTPHRLKTNRDRSRLALPNQRPARGFRSRRRAPFRSRHPLAHSAHDAGSWGHSARPHRAIVVQNSFHDFDNKLYLTLFMLRAPPRRNNLYPTRRSKFRMRLVHLSASIVFRFEIAFRLCGFFAPKVRHTADRITPFLLLVRHIS